MSSWERARHIPWERIPASGTDLDAQKERIFRELQRETVQDELRVQDRQVSPAVADATAVQQPKSTKIPFSSMELLRQAAFGGCIGTITGSVFGFMDSMRTAGESAVLQKASPVAQGRYLWQGTTRSATVFGVFYGGYHVAKYGFRVTVDPGELLEMTLAGGLSTGVLLSRPTGRPYLPYAAMLIFMDGVHVFMRATS